MAEDPGVHIGKDERLDIVLDARRIDVRLEGVGLGDSGMGNRFSMEDLLLCSQLELDLEVTTKTGLV